MTEHAADRDKGFFSRFWARLRGAEGHLPKLPESEVTPDCIQRRTEGDRSFPAPGLGDTVMSGTMKSPYDVGIKLFADDEVLKVHRSHRDWLIKVGDGAELPREIFSASERRPGAYRYVPSGRFPQACVVYRDVESANDNVRIRHLVPQLAMRSCGYAAGMMVGLDALAARGKNARVCAVLANGVSDGSLSTVEHIEPLLNTQNEGLAHHGLCARVVRLSGMSASKLAHVAQQYGSLMVAIGGEIGGHFVVLDSAVAYRGDPIGAFRLRDPYHGWDVTITADALLERVPERRILLITGANQEVPRS